jgi:hypothetical protein
VTDEAASLQAAGNQRDGGALGTDHFGEVFLSEVQSVIAGTVLRHEEPADEPLLGFVEPIASCDLGEDSDLFLNEPKHEAPEFGVTVKRRLEVLERNAQGTSRELHNAARAEWKVSQQVQAADDAFPANKADFSRFTGGHRSDHGGETGKREVRVAWGGGLVE